MGVSGGISSFQYLNQGCGGTGHSVCTSRFGEVCRDAHSDTQEPEHWPQCLNLGVTWVYLLKGSV